MFKIPFNLNRSISINKPVSDVFNSVKDFNSWKKWSPWLYMEPSCPVNIKNEPGQVGHFQEWNGDRIGSGNIKISSLETNKAIHYDLYFLKPWKSYSRVKFIFEDKGGVTELTWDMQGSLPVFLFWMKKMMGAWVGNDFVRGLTMLKDLLETGEVKSAFNIESDVSKDPLYYLGKERSCPIKDIGPAMKEDLASLEAMVEGGKLPKPESVLSIYKKFDMANGNCVYITALGYSKQQKAEDSSVVSGSLPTHKAVKVTHKGAYRHLGNGWSTGMNYLRYVKKKQAKSVPPYEVYVNSPEEAEEKDLQTDIYFPLK